MRSIAESDQLERPAWRSSTVLLKTFPPENVLSVRGQGLPALMI
jgi:hypothetical protein